MLPCRSPFFCRGSPYLETSLDGGVTTDRSSATTGRKKHLYFREFASLPRARGNPDESLRPGDVTTEFPRPFPK